MSKFSFIVSNSALPEIDLTNTVRMKYGEYKKLNIQPSKESILNHLDDKSDDLEIIIMDKTKMHHLKITLSTNRPYDLEGYTQKEYIYWLEENSGDVTWREQLYEYLKGLKNRKDDIEIWSIWVGDGPQKIKHVNLKLSDLQLIDLEVLKSMRMNYCIKFE